MAGTPPLFVDYPRSGDDLLRSLQRAYERLNSLQTQIQALQQPVVTQTTVTAPPSPTTQVVQTVEPANYVYAGPVSGVPQNPTWRLLVSADIPLATSSVTGAVKPDNTTITIAAGVLSTVSTGTVTSVALAAPAEFVVSGSPVTSSGTLTLTKAVETANTVWAGPTTGSAAQPTFRALVSADIPALAYVTSVALTMPAIFSVAGSPVTSSGTLAVTLATETANTVWAGPTSGGAATPTFRALVTADMPAGTGTVTSVALAMPAIFSVAGSPVTTSGTFTVTLATETANTVWAGPTTGAAATPTFRSLVNADMPGSGAGSGTVTSVALTAPSEITVGGSPITASGTLALTWTNETAHRFFAGPNSGGAATPTFRSIVQADLPVASSFAFGIVQVDGTTITAVAGVISAVGTVTSVGLALPSIFTVTVSPVTSSGTLTAVLATQSANTVFSGPTTGAASAPTFRALVAADIPSLPYVPTTRLVGTTSPLAGGGALSADLALTVGTATTSVLGVVKPDGTTITIAGGIITATAASAANKSIELNGVDVSDDWVVTVNSPKQVTVNGV